MPVRKVSGISLSNMPSKKLENGSLVLKKITTNMDVNITENNSQAELIRSGEDTSDPIASSESDKTIKHVKKREWIFVFILCFVNLINYMDRFTLAGVLNDIQKYYNIGDDKGGLLQTAFVFSYMIFAPIFGYLGDRYNRKYIMAAGVSLWSLTTLLGSFMENFWFFVLFRALVGIGEASYSTIAPTIISDLFVNDVRSKMLALFYFAIPVGSGLGYIVGSETAKIFNQWQWGLRVTPALGLAAVLMILFILKDPERGESEGTGHMEATSWTEDIKELVRNRSFMLSTAGFTCVAFVAGALAWWGPKFILYGIRLQPNGSQANIDSVSYKFGLISMLSGIIGVPAGSFLAQRLRHRYKRVDPYICAIGLLVSGPLVFLTCISANINSELCFTLVFFAEVFVNLTWSIVADMLLYVVLPTRRSTAEGFQLLVSHALGDAGSPYLIGVLSEAFQISLQDTGTKDYVEFKALQYALFSTCFVEVIGGLFFLLNAFYIVEDKHEVERVVRGHHSQQLLTNTTESEQNIVVS